jgi:N-acetylglucosamine kinase-like BadF-type ATPase
MNIRHFIALEGGGTRCRADLMDGSGAILSSYTAGPVNTNFVAYDEARNAVRQAVIGALEAGNFAGSEINLLAVSLVGPRFGMETYGDLIPGAEIVYFSERDVVFARAGIYRPHGVAIVAATGATAWAIRQDNGREAFFGGWGSLLGDEGSAFSIGLLALRQSTRAYEGRLDVPTRLPEALCENFGFHLETYREELVRLAYGKPLSRHDIAGLAPLVTRLAGEGDLAAKRIVAKVVNDLASLALHAARHMFRPQESFDFAIGGGLLNAGEMIVAPLREGMAAEFPAIDFHLALEDPAEAVGKLALDKFNPGNPGRDAE